MVRPPSVGSLWLGGSALLLLLYAGVFALTSDATPTEALTLAIANVLPLTLLAAALRTVLKDLVMARPVPVQGTWHVGLAAAFATTWYALVIVLAGFFRGLRGQGGFGPQDFSAVAFTWQVFQGLIIYALVAAVCYAVRGGREAAPIAFVAAPRPLERYLTRDADEIRPVEVADIVAITGAQDYAEVTTRNGRRHLVRMSLAEFEARLDPARFIRVHRSTIINVTQLDHAEPAGSGRLLARMKTGESVEVSRSGAQALRALIV